MLKPCCLLLALLAASPVHAEEPATRRARVITALMRIAGTRIPRRNVVCEVAGPTVTNSDDSVTYPETRVGDFIEGYLRWALELRPTHVQSFSCAGQRQLSCEWTFGEKPNPRNPGWSFTLRFKVDARSGRVLPATLACEQVP